MEHRPEPDSNLDTQSSQFSGAELAHELAASAQSPETDQLKNTEFHFVFCEHIPENGTAIAKELTGCDIIAVEVISRHASSADKAYIAQNYTKYLSSEFSKLDKPSQDYTAKIAESDPFMQSVLQPLKGTDKQVQLIDFSADDTEIIELVNELEHINNDYVRKLKFEAPNAEIRSLLVENIRTTAEWSRKRETVVKEQLKDLAMQSTGDNPQSIGVVLGAAHTPVQHSLAQAGFENSRIFVSQGSPERPTAYQFSRQSEAVRKLVISPDATLDPTLVNRLLLEDIYRIHNYTPEVDQNFDAGSDSWSEPGEIVEEMANESITSLLNRIDYIKSQDIHILDKRFAIQKELLNNAVKTQARTDLAA